jgi:ribosome biogenesis GTPase A
MNSLLESNPLDDFIAMAEMHSENPFEVTKVMGNQEEFLLKSFTADKEVSEKFSSIQDSVEIKKKRIQEITTDTFQQLQLSIPRKPKWNYNMSVDEIKQNEKNSFIQWRRSIASLEQQYSYLLKLTPYEKNLEVWKQLWRVNEKSNIVIQVIDARNPLLYYTKDLYNYLSSEFTPSKSMILLINKADLLTDLQREAWSQCFAKMKIKCLFYSAFLSQFDLDSLSDEDLAAEISSDYDFPAVFHKFHDFLSSFDFSDVKRQYETQKNRYEKKLEGGGIMGAFGEEQDGIVWGNNEKYTTPSIAAQKKVKIQPSATTVTTSSSKAAKKPEVSTPPSSNSSANAVLKSKEESAEREVVKEGGNDENPEVDDDDEESDDDNRQSSKINQFADLDASDEEVDDDEQDSDYEEDDEEEGDEIDMSDLQEVMDEEFPRNDNDNDESDDEEESSEEEGQPETTTDAQKDQHTHQKSQEKLVTKVSVPFKSPVTSKILTRKELLGILTFLSKIMKDEIEIISNQVSLKPVSVSSSVKSSNPIDGRSCIGLVGFPNVGKSSVINTLLGVSRSNHGKVRVGVSSTPGKTKHFQTLILSPDIILCDCPGLVFPSIMSSAGEMLCSGILPINHMRDHFEPANLIAARVPSYLLEAAYGMKIERNLDYLDKPNRPPTGEEIMAGYCKVKGYITNGTGRWDDFRACKEILRDFNDGRILYVAMPPKISSAGVPEPYSKEECELWINETEKTTVRNRKIAERIENLKKSAASSQSVTAYPQEGPEAVDSSAPLTYEFVADEGVPEESYYEGSLAAEGSEITGGESQLVHPNRLKRDHKKLKTWGKKGRKLRDKTPYGESINDVRDYTVHVKNRINAGVDSINRI